MCFIVIGSQHPGFIFSRLNLDAILLRPVILFLPIKQFMVANCSKERPGSIVNETLKKNNFDTNRYIKRIGFRV